MASGFQFEDLMSMAEHNALKGEKKIKQCTAPQYNLGAPKPKKQTPKERQLSEGVKRFLQKKEEEERHRAEQERLKKEKLMQLRRQDKKACKRVSSMLRMTKSANKACMADAKDSFSESLAEQGEMQPDEDDYGYVSQYSQEMYKKLMDKYKQAPPPPKPTRAKPPAPIPVPQSLGAKQRQRAVEEHFEPTEERVPQYKEPEESSLKKKKAPPPDLMNFQALLALAGQKAQEPVQVKPKVIPTKEKEVFEFGRPMTAKEKAAFLKEKALKERVHALHESPNLDRSERDSAKQASSNPNGKFKIPSLKKKETESTTTEALNSSSTSSNSNPSVKSSKKHQESGRSSLQNIPPSSSQRSTSSLVPPAHHSKPAHSDQIPREHSAARKINSMQEKSSGAKKSDLAGDLKPKQSVKGITKPSPVEKLKASSNTSTSGINGKSDPRPLPLKAKSSIPASENRHPREPERQPQRSLQPSRPPSQPLRTPQRRPSPPRMKPPPPRMGHHSRPPQKRRVIESDEEYDSEMDDFIDDDEEQVDYSAMIRAITGYDRNRYRDVDEDDIKESGFHEQWREERISEKIGKQEDLEDMKMEEEEKKRKAMMRKKMRR